MLKNKKGLWFTRNKIIGNEKQITVTIPKPDWKCFEVDSRAILHSKSGITITRKVRAIGGGKQRVLTIPQDDFDIFSNGDIILIYPLKQPKLVSKSQKK